MLGKALLRGEKVYLTRPTPDDAPDYFKWRSNLDLMATMDLRAMYPDTEAEIREWMEQSRIARNYDFTIRRIKDDRALGMVGLRAPDWKNRQADLGIAIGETDAQGQGYGTDAGFIILRFGFLELNMNRIELGVISSNMPAIRSYEKLGFKLEATLRQRWYREGAYYDMLTMGILRSEWLAMQEAK